MSGNVYQMGCVGVAFEQLCEDMNSIRNLESAPARVA